MSNLQCPVTMILVRPGDDAVGLAGRLRDERISTIWCDSHPDALVTARAVAGELGAPAVRVQAAGAEALEALADEFRGETLLGIVPEPVLAELLDQLFPAERHRAPMSAGSCRLSYDGEAWTTDP